jgi:hypothetical protein
MDGLESLIASIDETDRLLDENASILGTVSVGKWVEGISGRNALFYMPNRYIFRSAEQERAFSADIIMRSTLGVTNGQILLRYTQQSDGSPTLPWLAINHRGEYLDLMQIAPFETVITGNGLPNTRLTALTIERFETYSDDFSLGTETTYAGFVGSERVTIVQNLNLSAADATLVAEYEITSASALDLRVLVAPIAGQRTTSVDEFEDGIAVAFVERASASPTITVKPVASGKIEVGDPSKGEVIVRNAGAKHLAFAVSFEPETQPFAQKGVFWPEDLIDDYQVGAVYLPDGQSLSARMARMEAHGFDFRSRAGGFILMVKGSPKGSD